MRHRTLFIGTAVLLLAAAVWPLLAQHPAEAAGFEEAEFTWREARDRNMRSPSSWLTVSGLFWLEEGENTFGSADGNDIRLPLGSAPAFAGVLVRSGRLVTLIAQDPSSLKVAGKPASRAILRSDAEGEPDTIEVGNLRLWVIERSGRPALRLRDLDSPAFRSYAGLDYFPPDPAFRVEGILVLYSRPKTVVVPTVVGTEAEMTSPGAVEFFLDGKAFRLQAFQEDPDGKRLFFVFSDETSGKETYEASRFMTAPVLDNGRVDMNFNRATNPPCAYMPFATCPLPPPENRLPIRIEAGEKKYPGGH